MSPLTRFQYRVPTAEAVGYCADTITFGLWHTTGETASRPYMSIIPTSHPKSQTRLRLRNMLLRAQHINVLAEFG